MDRYETIKLLNEDPTGSTSLVKRKADGQLLVCRKNIYSNINEANNGLREALSLSRFNSEFVTLYEDFFLHIIQDGVREYCAGGTLRDKLNGARERTNRNSHPEPDLLPSLLVERWIGEMCKALKEVHSVHVIHGNLNSENIFLTTHKNIKIGDFGHSRSKESNEDTKQKYYTAPEVTSHQDRSYKSDVWSLGWVIFEISTSRILDVDDINFNLLHEQGRCDLLKDMLRIFFPKNRAHIRNLVEMMLEADPLKRPSMDEVLNHEFFQRCTLQTLKVKELSHSSFEKLDDELKDGIVRILSKSDIDATVNLMAQELHNEPRIRFLFWNKKDTERLELTKLLMKYVVKFCAKKGNHLWGRINAEGKLQAAALWLPPNRDLRPSMSRLVRAGLENIMAWVKIGPKASLKIMMLIDFYEKLALNDLPEDCWILMHIAVEDSLQRKGLGRHLLSEIFKVVDFDGQCCATLCFDNMAVEFFLKLGFSVVKTIAEPIKSMRDCPACQLLIRKPRGDIDRSLSPRNSTNDILTPRKKHVSKRPSFVL